MLNQLIVVGRLQEIRELDNNSVAIKLIAQRPYKNENGEYENDIISIILKGGIAENVIEYCKKGDLLGVKGRIESNKEDNSIQIIADKVTFLSSRKENEEE